MPSTTSEAGSSAAGGSAWCRFASCRLCGGLRRDLGASRCSLFAVLEPAERHLDGLLLAVAHHHDIDCLADRAFGDDARQVAHFDDDRVRRT